MNDFLKNIFIFYFLNFIIILTLKYFEIINEVTLYSIIYAAILSVINSVVAIMLFSYSYKARHSVFMLFNFGGLGIRILILLFAIVLIIKFLNIDKYAFILVFFIFYFMSLLLEVLYFQRVATKKK